MGSMGAMQPGGMGSMGAMQPGGMGSMGAYQQPAQGPMSGNPAFQQGQQMYAEPFMQSGIGQQGGIAGLAQGQGQGQRPGPYSYQPYNPQQGYNAQGVINGMQGYNTPIPQQMPQSPYLAGYTYGGNGPPSIPAGTPPGTVQMPLSPVQAGQIPGNSSLPASVLQALGSSAGAGGGGGGGGGGRR
jgi:hypothetical protein